MTRNVSTHLTEEEFTDLLLGVIPQTVTRHLESCTACSEEARRVSGAIGTFAQHSRLWAERRAASQQRLTAPARHPVFAWLQRPIGIAAWSASVAALVLSATVGIRHLERTSAPVQPAAAVAPAPQPITPARLQADNELLYAIDGELRAGTTPPASRYGLQAVDQTVRTPLPKRMSD